MHEFSGGWLALAGRHYPGLAPSTSGDDWTIIVGDPLLDDDVSGTSPGDRTGAINRVVRREGLDSPALEARHPALIVLVEGVRSPQVVVSIRTDPVGGLPLYRASVGRGFVLATSPDFVAAGSAQRLDRLSAVELVSRGTVSFPHTLYRGVIEMAPSAVYRVARTGWRWKSSQQDLNWGASDPTAPDDRARRFTIFLEGQVAAVAKASADRPLTVGLSAGRDSRALLATLVRAAPGRARTFTGVPAPNRESQIAEEVALRAGVEHTSISWRGDDVLARFLTPAALAMGSHHRWRDAHYFGAGRNMAVDIGLGGFAMDNLFTRDGGTEVLRRRLERQWPVEAADDIYVRTAAELALPTLLREAIRSRVGASRAAAPELLQCSHLRSGWPLSRSLAFAHWQAARGEWLHYELLLSVQAVELAASWSADRSAELKSALLAPSLEAGRLLDIPVNPPSEPGAARQPWLSLEDARTADPRADLILDSRAEESRVQLGLDPLAVLDSSLLINVWWARRLSASGFRERLKRLQRRAGRVAFVRPGEDE